MPVFTASCAMLICGVCGVNDWITSNPRASEVMKLGSPIKGSRLEAGVDLAVFAVAAAVGAVRADAILATGSFKPAIVLVEWEAALGRRGELLINLPSCSPAKLAGWIAQRVASQGST
jgi:hypothetical protein